MIKLLIVDDSPTEIQILKYIIADEPDMKVVGCAKNGKEALFLAEKLKPDLITMDIHMPVMDGIEAIRHILAKHAIPIVVITSKLNDEAMNASYLALNAGALSVLEKPTDITSANFQQEKKRRIIDTIRSMAEIKVIRRKIKTKANPMTASVSALYQKSDYNIIAIGTSVGGPQALKTIFSKLPENFPVPILVVQHMTPGFIDGFTTWLNGVVAINIKQAQDQEILLPGNVYFANDDYHLEVGRHDNHLVAKLSHAPPVSGFCPSATVLFRSVSKICGAHAIGILLTGMGNDGAQGLLELKQSHGHTLIQDANSSIVHGMAGVAQALGAVDKVVELTKIADYLKFVTQGGK